MTTIDPTISLADLVDTRPGLARELESRGLDYCCGGARSLADACAERGLDPVIVAGELASVAPAEAAADWTRFSPTELVDHLEATHHTYLWGELPRLSALLETIVRVHGERHPELTEVAACYAEIRADLEPHLTKEERVLFPMIRRLTAAVRAGDAPAGDRADDGDTQALLGPVGVMLQEHDTVGQLLEQLRTLTDGYRPPADGCATYTACYTGLAELEADTHLHVHKENNVLFPLVLGSRPVPGER
jgi:regulator of cell morphogenesis and NO signaling